MSTPVKTLVRDELNYRFPEKLTNSQLANLLGLPEASVRRATGALLRAGEIHDHGVDRDGAWLLIGVPLRAHMGVLTDG